MFHENSSTNTLTNNENYGNNPLILKDPITGELTFLGKKVYYYSGNENREKNQNAKNKESESEKIMQKLLNIIEELITIEGIDSIKIRKLIENSEFHTDYLKLIDKHKTIVFDKLTYIPDSNTSSFSNTDMNTPMLNMFGQYFKILKEHNTRSLIDSEKVEQIIDFLSCAKEITTYNEITTKTKQQFYDKIDRYFNYSKNNKLFNNLIENNYSCGIEKREHLSSIDEHNVKVIVNLHGGIGEGAKIIKLPDNVNIVFLSPLSYDTSCDLYGLKNFLNTINSSSKHNIYSFLNNPNCFHKNLATSFFSESVIYYGGQYCIDIDLSRSIKDHVTGIHIYDTSKNTFTQDDSILEKHDIPISPDLKNTRYESNLIKFLKKFFNNQTKQYTLFIIACRGIYTDKYNTNMLKFYELMMKSLNFLIDYDHKNKDKNQNQDKIEEYIKEYKTCIGEQTDFSYNTRIRAQQPNSNNHLEKIKNMNNVKSSKTIKITNKSKIYIGNYNTHQQKNIIFNVIVNHSNIKKNSNSNNEYIIIQDIIDYIKDKLNVTSLKYKIFNTLDDLISMSIYAGRFVWEGYKLEDFNNIIITHMKIVKFIFKDYGFKYMIEYIYFCLDKYDTEYTTTPKYQDDTQKYYHKLLNQFEYNNMKELYEEPIPEIIINKPIHYNGIKLIISILVKNKTVKKLDLSKTNIGYDNALLIIEALKNNTSLEELNLEYCNINPKRINNIKKVLDETQNTTLKKIYFSFDTGTINSRFNPKAIRAVSRRHHPPRQHTSHHIQPAPEFRPRITHRVSQTKKRSSQHPPPIPPRIPLIIPPKIPQTTHTNKAPPISPKKSKTTITNKPPPLPPKNLEMLIRIAESKNLPPPRPPKNPIHSPTHPPPIPKRT